MIDFSKDMHLVSTDGLEPSSNPITIGRKLIDIENLCFLEWNKTRRRYEEAHRPCFESNPPTPFTLYFSEVFATQPILEVGKYIDVFWVSSWFVSEVIRITPGWFFVNPCGFSRILKLPSDALRVVQRTRPHEVCFSFIIYHYANLFFSNQLKNMIWSSILEMMIGSNLLKRIPYLVFFQS